MLHETAGLCLLLILALLTVLATAFLGAVLVNFTVFARVRPIVAAVITGIAVVFLGTQIPIPQSAITLFMVPLIAAAVAAGAVMTTSDWTTLGGEPTPRASSTLLGVVGIAAGVVSAYLASLTSIGRWALNSLGQDVIGNMPNEAREIRVAGAVCGFFIGCFAAIILVTVFARWHTR